MSLAGIWVGLAIAEEGPPSYPDLRSAPPEHILSPFDSGSRMFEVGKFISQCEQWTKGVVRDTSCVAEPGSASNIVERFDFRRWLSEIRPGVKSFLLRGDPAGCWERVTLERVLWEKLQEECRETEEYLVDKDPLHGEGDFFLPPSGMAWRPFADSSLPYWWPVQWRGRWRRRQRSGSSHRLRRKA